MRRFILTTIAALVAMVPATGADPSAPTAPVDLPSAEEMATRFTEGLATSLGLSDEQVPRVQSVLVDMMQRQREILVEQAGEEPNPSALQFLMRQIGATQNEAKEALKGVLTEQQLADFDDALLDQRANAVGEGLARRLQEPLGLTAEQRDEIAPIFASHARARAEAFKAASKSERKFGAFRAVREQATADQQKLEQELSTVLTPEQIAKYRQIAAEVRRARGRERAGAEDTP